MKPFISALTIALASLAGAAGAATLILDQSPDTLEGSYSSYQNFYVNQFSSQRFLTEFTVSETTDLTGIDNYGDPFRASVDDDVVVNIYSSVAGAPTTQIAAIDTVISIEDQDGIGSITGATRRHAEFDYNLEAGKYFIGISGDGINIAQTAFDTGAAKDFQVASNGSPNQNRLAVAIRLYGEPTVVPLPASLLLMIAGLAGLGGLAKRPSKCSA